MLDEALVGVKFDFIHDVVTRTLDATKYLPHFFSRDEINRHSVYMSYPTNRMAFLEKLVQVCVNVRAHHVISSHDHDHACVWGGGRGRVCACVSACVRVPSTFSSFVHILHGTPSTTDDTRCPACVPRARPLASDSLPIHSFIHLFICCATHVMQINKSSMGGGQVVSKDLRLPVDYLNAEAIVEPSDPEAARLFLCFFAHVALQATESSDMVTNAGTGGGGAAAGGGGGAGDNSGRRVTSSEEVRMMLRRPSGLYAGSTSVTFL